MKDKLPDSHNRIQEKMYEYLWNYHPETRRTFWHTPNEISQDYFLEMQIKEKYNGRVIPIWLIAAFKECKTRYKRLLNRRASIGVLSGVTDLVWYWKGKLYMFDIKIGTDKISDNQRKFIEACTAQGGEFYEINSTEQGIQIIKQIISTHTK